MRIQIIEEPTIDEIEIQIKCKEKNEYVKQLAANIFEEQVILKGRIENEFTQIYSRDIYYFESVDNRTYIYCEDNVYESDMKLYELEEKLAETKFTRINKACIINIAKLKKVKS